MLNGSEGAVLTSREACDYLRISRPTFAEYLQIGRTKGAKVREGLEGSQIRIGSVSKRRRYRLGLNLFK